MQMAQTWIEAAERLELAPARKSEPMLDAAISDMAHRGKVNPQRPPKNPKS
jgi:hypothetical protein